MDPSPQSGGKTLPLEVAASGIGFLLDRLGTDCHPLQFLRELTQNAIEAIQRTDEKQGEIVWDVEWVHYTLQGVYKLSIIDTGDGMTGPEMVKYINQLSSSVSEQSFMGNYGVGAKIAAATRNHEGLVYLSWKHGKGSMIHLWRDPRTGQYGLKQQELPDGSYGHYAEVEDDLKPPAIKDHGTMIVLLGNSETEDTMKAPEGAASPSRWIAKYLNTRYFSIPSGITVKSRLGWMVPRSNTNTNILSTITGQKPYLEKHSVASGTLQLTNAEAHWWILRDEDAISQNSGWIESSGHVAALYKDELYEMVTARSATAQLQQFGVIFGHKRVVIYVEPQPAAAQSLTTNTARTQLLVNSEPLPWADWASEFREKMPDEIKNLIDEVAAGSSFSDHSQSIRERLKQILDLFRVSRYKPTPSGSSQIDETSMTRGGEPRQKEASSPSGGGASGNKGGSAGSVYAAFLKKDGLPAQEVRPDLFPHVKWVSVADGTREQGEIEDRAAKFLLEQNTLLINADFRTFTDMIERWCQEYQCTPGIRQVVIDAVHNWFEQALVETVIGVQALQNAPEWSSNDIQKALSEEALTSAVMSRYHVNNSVKRELGSKLGRLAAA
jgi:hypothetical protein